ncbi:MAG: mercury(II) reductase [Candidatus Dormibacteraceae bacterium]
MAAKQMRINGMTCVHCEETITEALVSAGASNVEANWSEGRATFELGGSSDEQLTSAVEEAGYKIVSIETVARDQQGVSAALSDKPDEYDLVVIGSGSAAFAAAIHASESGSRVAMVESGVVGGTCVNVGCVPSKAMLAPADLFNRAGHHPFAGIDTVARGIDLARMVDSKAALVDHLRQEKYLDLAATYGFAVLHGRAEFLDTETLLCAGEVIRAGKYIIASGASPSAPDVPGMAESGYLTSTTALELKVAPTRLIVIGAGPIGLELGQLFLHLGSQVTFIARGQVAPREEPETSEALRLVLMEEGATVHTNAQLIEVRSSGAAKTVVFRADGSQREVIGDQILVATGRRPNTDGLGLERAGIETTERGAVRVDDFLATTNPRVWAAGDVAGHPQFVYLAAREGNIAAANAIEDAGLKLDLRSLPRVIFTSPTFAAAGLTDEQANAQGIECECRVLPMSAVPRALVNRDTHGFVKIVAERGTGRIVGASIVADGAGDVIQAAIYAIQFGLTTDQVANTWAPYLTFAEGFKLAAQTFTRDVSKLSCCAA